MIRVGRPWNLLLMWMGSGPPGLSIYMLVLLTRLLFNPHTAYSDVGGTSTNNNNNNINNYVRHRPEQNRVTWETPSSEAIPLLQEPIGVLASYATHVQTQV
jgi:hypothetical protein